MDDHWNFSFSSEHENRPQSSRFGHQSLLSQPVHVLPPMFEALMSSRNNFNPQIPSLDGDEFELPSMEEFEETSKVGRSQALFDLMSFDIDDAASHAQRLNTHNQEPMLIGEIRLRMKDLQRLHRDISSAFQELMDLKLAPEDRQKICEHFNHHRISFNIALSSYEMKLREARGNKPPFRIDFRDYRSGNVAPKFTKSLCSGDIALLPVSMEQPVPLATVTTSKPVRLTPLLQHNVNNVYCFESNRSKPSISPRLSSAIPSVDPSQLVRQSANVLPVEVPFLSSSASSLPGSSTMPASQVPFLNLMKHQQNIGQGSANASSSVARFRTPSPDHSAVASPEAARTRMMPTQSLQRPANVSSEATRFHLHTFTSQRQTNNVSNSATLQNPTQGSANASPSVARFRTPSPDHSAVASPEAARTQMIPSQSTQKFSNVSPEATQFKLHKSTSKIGQNSANDVSVELHFSFENVASKLKESSRTVIAASLPACLEQPAPSLSVKLSEPTVRISLLNSEENQVSASEPIESTTKPSRSPELTISSSAPQLFTSRRVRFGDVQFLSFLPVSTFGSSAMPTSSTSTLISATLQSTGKSFAIASSSAARIRISPKYFTQRPANANLKMVWFHLHLPSSAHQNFNVSTFSTLQIKSCQSLANASATLDRFRTPPSCEGLANASPPLPRFRTPSSIHVVIASFKISRIHMTSNQSLQRPAKTSIEMSRFHLQATTLIGQTTAANVISLLFRFRSPDKIDVIRFFDHYCKLLKFIHFLLEKWIASRAKFKDSKPINASSFLARLRKSSTKHFVNMGKEVSQFKMQRPANTSLGSTLFHLHLPLPPEFVFHLIAATLIMRVIEIVSINIVGTVWLWYFLCPYFLNNNEEPTRIPDLHEKHVSDIACHPLHYKETRKSTESIFRTCQLDSSIVKCKLFLRKFHDSELPRKFLSKPSPLLQLAFFKNEARSLCVVGLKNELNVQPIKLLSIDLKILTPAQHFSDQSLTAMHQNQISSEIRITFTASNFLDVPSIFSKEEIAMSRKSSFCLPASCCQPSRAGGVCSATEEISRLSFKLELRNIFGNTFPPVFKTQLLKTALLL